MDDCHTIGLPYRVGPCRYLVDHSSLEPFPACLFPLEVFTSSISVMRLAIRSLSPSPTTAGASPGWRSSRPRATRLSSSFARCWTSPILFLVCGQCSVEIRCVVLQFVQRLIECRADELEAAFRLAAFRPP
jgi:hypothetical protein